MAKKSKKKSPSRAKVKRTGIPVYLDIDRPLYAAIEEYRVKKEMAKFAGAVRELCRTRLRDLGWTLPDFEPAKRGPKPGKSHKKNKPGSGWGGSRPGSGPKPPEVDVTPEPETIDTPNQVTDTPAES